MRQSEWWIVRFRDLRDLRIYAYLRCKNAYSLRLRSRTRKGRARPRQWEVSFNHQGGYQCPSLKDAKAGTRSAPVKKFLKKHGGFAMEIVHVVETLGLIGPVPAGARVDRSPSIQTVTESTVVERVCPSDTPPLLVLALEAL